MSSRFPAIDPQDFDAYQHVGSDFYNQNQKIINSAFRENILPAEDRRKPFPEADAPLYVPDREYVEHPKSQKEKISYEEFLNTEFWDPEGPEFVCVLGPPGSGKSTLIDYYLRCYCPKNCEGEGRKEDFERKLIINMNLRSITDVMVLREEFFRCCKREIIAGFESRGIDIEVINDYEMWDKEFRWDREQHDRAQLASGLEQEIYRHNLVNQKKLENQDWVECAFDFLSKYMAVPLDQQDLSACPFRYIVVILDNLDQSDLNVQIEAVRLIKTYFDEDPKLNFWQIYVPLWEESYHRFKSYSRPLPNDRIVKLKPPRARDVIQRRTTDLLEKIEAPYVKAKEMGLELKNGSNIEDAIQFIISAKEESDKKFLSLIDGLSAYSCRMNLELWKGLLANERLFIRYVGTHARNSGDPSFGELSQYVLVDALMCGMNNFHNPARISSPVANVFNVVEDHEGPRDMLIGLHILFFLQKSNRAVIPFRSIERNLGILLYEPDDLLEALERLNDHEVVRIERDSDGGPVKIHIPKLTIKWYLALLRDRAYIDNISMVTPLEEEFLDDVDPVMALNVETFEKRVRNSIAFLEQLLADERRFIDPELSQNSVGGNERDTFYAKLRSSRIPSFFHLIGAAYLENLRNFERNHPFPDHVFSAEDWADLFNHPILMQASKHPRILRES